MACCSRVSLAYGLRCAGPTAGYSLDMRTISVKDVDFDPADCFGSQSLGNLFLEAKHIIRIAVRSMEVFVKKGGIIELPNSIMVELGLSEGKKVF